MAKLPDDAKAARCWERVVDAWLALPFGSYNEIAELAGINRCTFSRYRKNPEFMEYYHERCKSVFQCMEASAMVKLSELIEQGDFRAVKYQLDAMGYTPVQKVEQKTSTTINVEVEGAPDK